MSHPLDGSRLHITRAEQHFDTLKAEIDLFLEENPYPVEEDVDPDSGLQRFRIAGDLPTLPPGWGVVVYELGNNCRSALDYIIAELCIRHGGDPERLKVQFPISDDRDRYWKAKRKRSLSYRDRSLQCVPDEWRECVDAVQPCRHLSEAARRDDPLTLLAWLNNANKHRELHPAYGAIYVAGYMLRPTTHDVSLRNLAVKIVSPNEFYVETDFMVSQLPSEGKNATIVQVSKVQMEPKTPAEVVFGERNVTLANLKRLVQWTDAIVAWFVPAFD